MSPSKFKNINVVEPSEEHVLGTLDPVSGSSALNVSSAGSPSRIEYYKNENIYSSLSPTSQHSEPPFLYNIKFYRFMICEWFYSYIDQPLFTKENNNFEFLALLKTYFPLLYTRSLNGIEWNYIRKRLQRVVPVRRTSSAFFLQERIRLERCREKMRFLMENQLIDYLDDDLPVVIPRPLDVGSLVRATLFEPQYGSYVGTVISIEQHGRLYRVRFTIDSFQNEVELPDFRLALEQIPLQTETAEVVTVPVKHIRQIALLQQTVHEKNQLLDEMENIRLNAVGRRAMGVCMMERDQEQSQLYIELIKKLIQLNRTLLQVVKLIAFDYQQFMFEPLATDSEENNLIVENQVEEIAEQLLDGYVLVKEASANPTAKLLWSTTMQHLYGRPDLLKQLEKYLASQIGTVFNPTMPSSS
ncbi:uncharacterized protein LOC128728941 [Anopheles nili]|uniref:uncharacterized protein LOC128728941 n=1 Tax=Anopheles nili TaxID=185578 RepID=UPI00237B42DA|nr:uncharacterized protein LOC128728941 [Anopheles nili]